MSSPGTTRRRFLRAGSFTLAAVGLAGCRSDGEEKPTPSETAAPTASAENATSTVPAETATSATSRSSTVASDAPSSRSQTERGTGTPAPTFELEHETGEHVDVAGSEGPVARYMYGYEPERRRETYKTYLHVIDPATGGPVTSGPSGLYDHHRGIFVGWDELAVGGETHDFWHFDGGERMLHDRFEGIDAFPRTGTLTAITDWITGAGRAVLSERREMTFRQPAFESGLVVIDLVTTLTAGTAAVELRGDSEHAGIQYRPHNDVARNGSAAYVFPDGAFSDSNPGPDRVTDVEGLPWVGQTHLIGDRQYFVQHMNHPGNPPETVYSAYRPYGRFGAFFEATIPAGESLTVRYRFVIGRGDAPPRSALADRYGAFSTAGED